jgi:NAD(P)-dependent dehydrogenase (short-subunit alcohol dehydrogenase family)
LDVLVNNAAATIVRRTTTSDGYETTFALNHLAYFLLTGLLLPLLRQSAPARIVSVASEGHRRAPLDLNDLQSEKSYSVMRVYFRSKTANILWNQELARRLEGSGVTANCLHPGAIRSNLGQGNGPILDVIQRVVTLFMKSPEKGAATSIYLATSPEVEGLSGRYFVNCREKKPAGHATDMATAQRLWEISEELVDYRYP